MRQTKFLEFSEGAARSVVAGVVLAFLFFAWREWVAPLPALTGTWYCVTFTKTDTDGIPDSYEEMLLGWDTMLLQSGTAMSGSAEKDYEISSSAEGQTDRDRGQIEGFLQSNQLSADRLLLHMIVTPQADDSQAESGQGDRQSTLSYDLIIRGKKLEGEFAWTVAGQRGRAVCAREQDRSFLHFLDEQRVG